MGGRSNHIEPPSWKFRSHFWPTQNKIDSPRLDKPGDMAKDTVQHICSHSKEASYLYLDKSLFT